MVEAIAARPWTERLGVVAPRWRWLLVYVVVVPMLATSAGLGTIDVIFPEAAALALGVLALELPGWVHSPAKLALVPPAFAALGVLLAHAGLPRWAGVAIALTGAAVGLQLVGSRLAPSLSAGVFPVVFGVRTWKLPVTVLVICLVLAAAVVARNRRVGRVPVGASDRVAPEPGEIAAAGTRMPTDVMVAAWATAVLWVVVAWPVLGLGTAAVAPPLVVAMLERTASANASATTGVRHWATLVAAAAAGSLLAGHVRPAWVGGLIAVAIVLAVFSLLGGPHPPALAIALIPQVSEAGRHAGPYVANIALGAAVLYIGASLICRLGRSKLVSR